MEGHYLSTVVLSRSVTDCIFSNNTGGGNGGAVAILDGSCDIAGSTFNDNTTSLGGALFFYEASIHGPLDVSEGSSIINSNFSNNAAETTGGVIYSTGGLIYIADSIYVQEQYGPIWWSHIDNIHKIITCCA